MSILLELRFERNVNIYKLPVLPNHISGKLLDLSLLVKNDL